MVWLAILALCYINFAPGCFARTPIENEIYRLRGPYNNTMCVKILDVDCTQYVAPTHRQGTICGSDGLEYKNACFFAQSQCTQLFLSIYTHGQCPTSAPVKGLSTNPGQSSGKYNHDPGLDLVKDVFCNNMHTINCGIIVDADICATNGQIYRNRCLFAKVKCYEPDIDFAEPSTCHEPGLIVKTTAHAPPLIG